MRILFVITGLGMGGAENVVCNLADYYTSLGCEVAICYLTGPVIVKPRNESIELIDLGVKKDIAAVLSIFKLRQVIRLFNPDVVHSHMVHANLLARISGIGLISDKLLCTAHNKNEGGNLRRLIYRATDRLCHLTTNVSQEAVDEFVKNSIAPRNRISVVLNGIDIDRFRCTRPKELEPRYNKAICVGRLTEQKDYANLFYAMEKLKKRGELFFKVDIVGDGPLKEELHDLLHKLALLEEVNFMGMREDIPELMNKSDFFILPSKYEGFGLVVAEAMACEIPVVATDSGGVKEVLNDHGLLAKPENSESLASTLLDFYHLDTALKTKMVKEARLYVVENFSIKRMSLNYMDIYTKMMK